MAQLVLDEDRPAEPAGDELSARDRALALARERVETEAGSRVARERSKARRMRLTQVIVGGVFVIMLFERAVNGGLF